MSVETWLDLIRKSKKTSFIQDGKRKVHFQISEGVEMVEEYAMDTDLLVRRAWRKKKEIGGQGKWEVEIGEPENSGDNLEAVGIKVNSNEPTITRRNTKLNLEWRIRNLVYPIETYSVTAEPKNKCIVVRTTVKKYFKKLEVPDLERIGVALEQKRIEFTHKYNTLIITYKKPQELINTEKAVIEDVKKLKQMKDGDMDCKPS